MSYREIQEAWNVALLIEKGMAPDWAEHFAKQWSVKCAECKELSEKLAALNLCEPNFLSRVLKERDEAREQLEKVMSFIDEVADCNNSDNMNIKRARALRDLISKSDD